MSTCLISAAEATTWPSEISWDDLLVVIYDENDFPTEGSTLITQYLRARPNQTLLLPVALNPEYARPPEAASAIKSLVYNDAAQGQKGRLVNRVGGMLNLKLVGRNTKIFISYRTSDGIEIAKQLETYLACLGYA